MYISTHIHTVRTYTIPQGVNWGIYRVPSLKVSIYTAGIGTSIANLTLAVDNSTKLSQILARRAFTPRNNKNAWVVERHTVGHTRIESTPVHYHRCAITQLQTVLRR